MYRFLSYFSFFLFCFHLNANANKTIDDLVVLAAQYTPSEKIFAREIVESLYECTAKRAIMSKDGLNPHGQEFPLNPELIYTLMEQAEGKTILEIGGARGQNAILLGLAGAKRVYLNDFEELEVSSFNDSVAKIKTPGFQEKFTGLVGDCFDLPKKIEANSVDIILVRNVFHLLKTDRYQEFFNMIKSLLKSDGKLAMTVNNRRNQRALDDLDNKFTKFATYSLVGPGRVMLFQKITPLDVSFVAEPTSYTSTNLARYVSGQCVVLQDAWTGIDESVKEAAMEYISDSTDSSRNGWLFCLKNVVCSFTPVSMSSIMEEYGFVAETTRHIGGRGHYLTEDQIQKNQEKAVVLGVIARLVDEDSE